MINYSAPTLEQNAAVSGGRLSPISLVSRYYKSIGLRVKAPIDVEGIAGFLNIRIYDEPCLEESNEIGQIVLSDDSEKFAATIKINPFQNSYLPRRRFTIAHEIGHYCLHLNKTRRFFKDSATTMSRTASYWQLEESEANSFAAELLMPSDLLMDEIFSFMQEKRESNASYAVTKNDLIDSMAFKFDVSTKAMEYKLDSLFRRTSIG